jgi:hypothetical protein
MMTKLVRPHLLVATLVALQTAQAQVKPAAPAFISACDLQELNREYVFALNHVRHQLYPNAPIVRFDPALFVLTALHTAKMEQVDSLYHATPPGLRCAAELIGTKHSIKSNNAKTLVRFMLTSFQNSEPHCELQSNLNYIYVAICSTSNYYCVRLSDTPSVVYPDEQQAFAKLGVKPEVKAKQVPRSPYQSLR